MNDPILIEYPGIYIGIGMVLSLLITETLGVTAGGIIVPGYIAMHPGMFTHYHGARPVLEGARYVVINFNNW